MDSPDFCTRRSCDDRDPHLHLPAVLCDTLQPRSRRHCSSRPMCTFLAAGTGYKLMTLRSKMILASIIALGDGMQGSSTGILRGVGRPGLAANANLFSYWVLGLPIGAYITWRTLDVAALWSGLAIAVASAAILMNIFILRTDWEKCADEALERMAESDENAHLSSDDENERLLA